MPFVVDNSVTMGWFLAPQATPYTAAVAARLATASGEQVWVPALWMLEFANVLRTACKRQKLTAARAHGIIAETLLLPIRIDNETPQPTEILALALRHDLTSYDAAYLDLALRLQLPIATQDAALRDAALASGVGIWKE